MARTTEASFPVPEYLSAEARAILARPAEPAATSAARDPDAIVEEMFGAMYDAAVRHTSVKIRQRQMQGVTVRELLPPEPKPGKVLMGLHGGAYTVMGGRFSILEGLPLAEHGDYRVLAVDYRMPPAHPFPAAVDDGVAVYRELLDNHDPKDIAIFGTSAGGGLTAAVVLQARDAGLPLPAAVVMHTPWSDLSKTGDSYFTNDGVDPTIPSYDTGLAGAARLYAGTASLKDPLVSPVYADYAPGFPPALLSTGTRDLLLSCTVRLHRRLRRAGVDAELHVFDAMWHGFDAWVPEGEELRAETLAFLARRLGA